jgi:hypothetical protein
MRAVLLLLALVVVGAWAITVTHYPDVYDRKRHTEGQGVEYLLGDGRYWDWQEIAGVIERIKGAHGKGCALKDVSQSNASSYLVVWCASATKVNPFHLFGPTAANVQPTEAEVNGPKYAIYTLSGPGVQASAPTHLDRIDSLTATYDTQCAFLPFT